MGVRKLCGFERLSRLHKEMKKKKHVRFKLVVRDLSQGSKFRKMNSAAQEYLEDSKFYDLDLLSEESPFAERKVRIDQKQTVKEGKLKSKLILSRQGTRYVELNNLTQLNYPIRRDFGFNNIQ